MPLSWGHRPRNGGSLLQRLQSNTGQRGPVSALLSFTDSLRGGPHRTNRRKQKGQPVPARKSGQYFQCEERAMSHTERLMTLSMRKSNSKEFSKEFESKSKTFRVVPNEPSKYDLPWTPWEDLESHEGSTHGTSVENNSGFCQMNRQWSVSRSDGSTASSSPPKPKRKQPPQKSFSALEAWRREADMSEKVRQDNWRPRKEGELQPGAQGGQDLRMETNAEDDKELTEKPQVIHPLAHSCLKTHNQTRHQALIHKKKFEPGRDSGEEHLLLHQLIPHFDNVLHTPKDDEKKGEQRDVNLRWYRNMTTFEMVQLAAMFNMPIEQAKAAREIFSKYDTDADGELDPEEFQLLLCSMLREQYPRARDVPKYLFTLVEKSQDGKVDFYEFLEWFSMNSFSEGLLLPPEQQRMRRIARKWGIPITEVEKMKLEFDRFDSDSSGRIDMAEFRRLLEVLLKVPSNVELPDNRVESFWKEIDADASGEVDFEEFLSWYRKYFDTKGGGFSRTSTIEAFYSSVRGCAHKSMHDSASDDDDF